MFLNFPSKQNYLAMSASNQAALMRPFRYSVTDRNPRAAHRHQNRLPPFFEAAKANKKIKRRRESSILRKSRWSVDRR